MKSKKDCLKNIDLSKIRTALLMQVPLEVTSYTLPRPMEQYCYEVLTMFLTECGIPEMSDNFIFCLGELLTNAKKANTKRVYFWEKGLDINNATDYDIGMMTFKEDTISNIDHYLEEQKKAGLYVKLCMQRNSEDIVIEIKNNSVLNEFEKARIQEKIQSEDAFGECLDQTEGAGLGIKICILMLEKNGLSKDCFRVFSTETETITQIIVPYNRDGVAACEEMSRILAEHQDTIPVLEENLDNLSALLKKQEFSKSAFIKQTFEDAGTTLLLMKNAALTSEDSFRAHTAIKKIGADRLKEIFRKENPELQLFKDDEKVRGIWEHSKDVAFYAYNLMKNFNDKDERQAEEMYCIALLHDIERIILAFPSERQKQEIDRLITEKKILECHRKSFFEGGFHGVAGYYLAKKWQLPEKICQIMKYHHDPGHAAEEYRTAISVLYIADVMDYYNDGTIEFYQIDKKILEKFNIKSEQKFSQMIKTMNKLK